MERKKKKKTDGYNETFQQEEKWGVMEQESREAESVADKEKESFQELQGWNCNCSRPERSSSARDPSVV